MQQTALPTFSLLSLENLIDYAPLTVKTQATIWDAITLMNQSQPVTQRVFVVENWRVVGLFSLENVLEVVKSEIDLKNSKITEVMKTLAIKINDSSVQDKKSILKVLTELKEPVLIEDEKKHFLGYIAPEKISYLLLKDYQFRIKQAEQGNNELQENLEFKSIALNGANNARLACKPIIYANPEFKCICSENISQGEGSKNKFIENIKTLDSQKEKVVFEIKDRGIGIASDDLPSLLDSFHRCKNVGNIPGTGLGLSITKKCVDMLEGRN